MKLTWIAAACQSCASPGVTNEPDLSGLRVGPEPINANKYSAEGGTRTLTPEGTGT